MDAQIREAYSGLSPGKKKIAEWILQNTEEAAFYSAAMIAKAVGISESVVTRFSLDIGFSGFRELQEANQRVLRNRLMVAERLRQSLSEDPQTATSGHWVFERNIENIRASMAAIAPADLDQAAEMIVKANRIGIAGLRSAVAPGLVLYTFLNEILGNVRLIIPDIGDVFDYLRFFGPQDLVIGASFLMSRNFTLDVMRFAKERGCQVIAITDSAVAPISQTADLTFVVHTTGEFISYAASMALVDALLYQVTTKVKDQSLDRVTETESLLATYFGSRVNGWKK